jgi:hypothetical protein
MSMLTSKAEALAAQVHPGAGAMPPGLLSLLQTILSALISFLQGCGQKPAQALQSAQNPGVFARMRVRRVARQELQHHPNLQALQPHIEAGVFALVKQTSEDEMQQMMDELT